MGGGNVPLNSPSCIGVRVQDMFFDTDMRERELTFNMCRNKDARDERRR